MEESRHVISEKVAWRKTLLGKNAPKLFLVYLKSNLSGRPAFHPTSLLHKESVQASRSWLDGL